MTGIRTLQERLLQREILITNVAHRTFPDAEVLHILIQDAKEKIAR